MARLYYSIKQILFYLILIIYIILLAKILLFKYVSPLELFSAGRLVIRSHNLIPFKSIFLYFISSNVWIALLNIVGNIVIFIPFGIYLQVFKRKKKIFNCVAITFALSLCVEITQFILGIGVADIDDILLNTLGGLLGVFIYKILNLVLKDESKTKTAITVLYCIIAIGCLVFIKLLELSGMIIRIF